MRMRPLAHSSLALVVCFVAACTETGGSRLDPGSADALREGQVGPTKRSLPRRASRDITSEEKVVLSSLPPASEQHLLVVREDGSVERLATTAAGMESLALDVRERDPSATVVPDFQVEVRRPAEPAFQVDKQLLFSGKEEFGLAAWRKAYPQADGRGVRIGVVDDGVALGRPGLLTTSEGL